MARIATFLTSVALVPVLALSTTGAGGERAESREPAPVTVVGGAPAQVALVEDVAGRFERAGLELPTLSVTFHPDEAGCDGVVAHHRSAGSRSLVEVCATAGADPGHQEYVIAHELAHAWAESTLDDAARREYVAFRDLATWNDRRTPWRARGSEHAADTLAWGVLGHRGALLRLTGDSCDRLHAGYFRLTARLPAAGLAACEAT